MAIECQGINLFQLLIMNLSMLGFIHLIINRIYMDFMEEICPALDQCLSALTGYVIKWDHSFKLVKYMTKLNGIATFAALFTLVNEFEQIRYQVFAPTKALRWLPL